MKKKYIHYCWFGGNPLPKLAKKCIKSWKKYLPDFEIIEWNEKNVDLNECPFIKEAYENKKWAFVADYVRTKVMYEMGGIYFDTDMEVVKNIDHLIKDYGFLGVEDSKMIACGVWYEPHPKSYLSTKMLEFYRSQKRFDIDNMYAVSIPRIISGILDDFDYTKDENQKLKNNIIIYKREYFYPYSYDRTNNIFTDNTCMIHYYDASWVPKFEQRENKIFRIFGKKKGAIIIKVLRKGSHIIKRCLKLVLYPLILYKRYKSNITQDYINSINLLINEIPKYKNKEYLTFVNPNWMGVKNATYELFENIIHCGELYRKKDIKKIAKLIKENGINQVIFSGFCIGWKDLCIQLHKQGIIVKTYFHGSHSQVNEPYGWARNMEIFRLHKKGVIDMIATCKASLVEFYKKQGCNMVLLRNRVNLKPKKSNNKQTKRIGLYAAKTEDFRKNVFSQISAISLLGEDYVLDMVPITTQAIKYCELLNIKLEGSEKNISREALLKRMSKNDVNLYVTFSECAPMLPLESFASGVPCITGNNHHYFIEDELEKYLVVNNESSAKDIADKIKLCLKNREKVLDLYNNWYEKNDDLSKKSIEDFIAYKKVNQHEKR